MKEGRKSLERRDMEKKDKEQNHQNRLTMRKVK